MNSNDYNEHQSTGPVGAMAAVSTHQAKATTVFSDPNSKSASVKPTRPRVAVLLAGGLLIVSAFQVALTFGAPFGAAAMGGTNHGQLPDAVRVVTGVVSVVWLFAALVVLARGGVAARLLPKGVYRVGTWLLVGFLGLGALMQFASSSPWERFGWGPFTIALFILCLVLARSGLPSDPATRTPPAP